MRKNLLAVIVLVAATAFAVLSVAFLGPILRAASAESWAVSQKLKTSFPDLNGMDNVVYLDTPGGGCRNEYWCKIDEHTATPIVGARVGLSAQNRNEACVLMVDVMESFPGGKLSSFERQQKIQWCQSNGMRMSGRFDSGTFVTSAGFRLSEPDSVGEPWVLGVESPSGLD